MKIIKIISCLIIIGILSSCATVPFALNPLPEGKWPKVITQEIQLNNNFDPSLQLNGRQHVFNYDFELKILDSLNQQLLIVGATGDPKLKEKPVFLFDLNNENIVWQLQSATPGFKVWFQSDLTNSVVFTGSNKVFSIDRQTGQKVWEKVGGFAILDASKDLVYSKVIGNKTTINVFDIRSGNSFWTSREVNYGWWGTENQMLEDRIWLAGGDGIHTFDLKTGKGWDVDIPTNAKGGTGKVVASVVLSALLGTYSTATQDRYDFLTSNSLVIDDRVYCAGNRIMVCADLNDGKEIWRIDLPEVAAHSVIFDGEDHIFMLALGWCYINFREGEYSIPYVAKFDKLTGERLLYKPFGSNRRVDDYRTTPNSCDILSGNVIYCFDRSGPENSIINTNLGEGSSYLDIIDNPDDIFISPSEENAEFKNLTAFNSPATKLWALTTTGIIQYGENLEVENSFPNSKINFLIYKKNNLNFIRSYYPVVEKIDFNTMQSLFGTIKILDSQENNKLLGEILIDQEAEIVEDKLYLWDSRSVSVITLESIYQAYIRE